MGWRGLFTELAHQKIGSATFGSAPPFEADKPANDEEAEKALHVMAPKVAGVSVLKSTELLRLLALRKQVVSLGLRRLEIRACNMGQDKDGLRDLRDFICVRRLLAPIVFTFICTPLSLNILPDPHFTRRVKRIPAGALHVNTPIRWFTCGLAQILAPLAQAGPQAVSYPAQSKRAPDPSCYLHYVNNTVSGFAWGRTAHDVLSVRLFVYELLDLNGTRNYQSGTFVLGGFDALRDRVSPPREANGKAIVLPSEPEYHKLNRESS
jgi:hypothetical protein